MANNTALSTPPTAAASAETAYRYAEGEPFVLSVYFLVFGFWASAAGNDVEISAGNPLQGQVFAIPVPYICAYIYFQQLNQS